jgi:hypothetical protein
MYIRIPGRNETVTRDCQGIPGEVKEGQFLWIGGATTPSNLQHSKVWGTLNPMISSVPSPQQN